MTMKFKRLMMFNQMAGTLFRELAEDLSAKFPEKSELITGNPVIFDYIGKIETLKIIKFPLNKELINPNYLFYISKSK